MRLPELKAEKEAKEKEEKEAKEREERKRKPAQADEECSICYEAFGTEKLVWCEAQCGQNFHAVSCFLVCV